jgi:hypothetical protein
VERFGETETHRHLVRSLLCPLPQSSRGGGGSRAGADWLADAERSRERTDSDLDEAIAELSVVVYAQEAELNSGAGAPAEAARYLLSRLAGRGYRSLLSSVPDSG